MFVLIRLDPITIGSHHIYLRLLCAVFILILFVSHPSLVFPLLYTFGSCHSLTIIALFCLHVVGLLGM